MRWKAMILKEKGDSPLWKEKADAQRAFEEGDMDYQTYINMIAALEAEEEKLKRRQKKKKK